MVSSTATEIMYSYKNHGSGEKRCNLKQNVHVFISVGFPCLSQGIGDSRSAIRAAVSF